MFYMFLKPRVKNENNVKKKFAFIYNIKFFQCIYFSGIFLGEKISM